MLLCSITGYDASGRIEELAFECGKSLSSIAIGYFFCLRNFLKLKINQL